jgi:phage baseplate assembly protein W
MANNKINPSDKSGVVSTGSRIKPYSDINLKLTLHPVQKDIVPLKDDTAVRNSIKNLLLTNFYERPFAPALGANLRGLLFEPADAMTRVSLRSSIKKVVLENEPRVENVKVEVINDPGGEAFKVKVIFKIKQIDTSDSLEIVLKRLR